MSYRHLFLILIFCSTLAGCQQNPLLEEKVTEKRVDISREVAQKEEDCTISNIPEGWWCYNRGTAFSLLLPSDFENHDEGKTGNFISLEKGNFLRVGYFPFALFADESRSLLQEGKLKEYMEYEQNNVCPPEKQCKTQLIPTSFKELTLGGNRFLRYEVELKSEGGTSISTHYASLIHEALVNFTSSEGEKVIPSPDPENPIITKKMENERLEEILATLKGNG